MIINSTITIESDTNCKSPVWSLDNRHYPEEYWTITLNGVMRTHCVTPFDASWDMVQICSGKSYLDTIVRSTETHVFWIPVWEGATIIPDNSVVVFEKSSYASAFPAKYQQSEFPRRMDSGDIKRCVQCIDPFQIKDILYVTPEIGNSDQHLGQYRQLYEAIFNDTGSPISSDTGDSYWESIRSPFVAVDDFNILHNRYEIGVINHAGEFKEMIIHVAVNEHGPYAIRLEKEPWLPLWLSSTRIIDTLRKFSC